MRAGPDARRGFRITLVALSLQCIGAQPSHGVVIQQWTSSAQAGIAVSQVTTGNAAPAMTPDDTTGFRIADALTGATPRSVAAGALATFSLSTGVPSGALVDAAAAQAAVPINPLPLPEPQAGLLAAFALATLSTVSRTRAMLGSRPR